MASLPFMDSRMRVSATALLLAGLLALQTTNASRATEASAAPAGTAAETAVTAESGKQAAAQAAPEPDAQPPQTPTPPAPTTTTGTGTDNVTPPADKAAGTEAVTGNTTPPPSTEQESLSMLNSSVAPGTFRTLHWSPGQYISSLDTPVPILVAHGREEGPSLCLTAAIHGDEINGIEIVRRVLHQIEPDSLKGTVIGVPIVNLDGFRRATRYLSDRRDLNRFFPGSPIGSYASRMAHSLFQQIILKCDYTVDIHTASFYRTNLPQLRGDLKNKAVLEFSRHFGGMSVLHNAGATGTLRRAANDAGIPSLTMEAGGPHALEQEAIAFGVKGLKNLMHNLNMYQTVRLWRMPQPVFYQSIWVRAKLGGIMLSKVDLDENVRQGQLLGRVIDPITNTSSDIVSPINGTILGKALDQVVSPGFATFHIGVVATEEQLETPLPATAPDLAPPTPAGAPTASPPIDPDAVEAFPDTES
ncbi:MAG: succinylglutamate desuccinylase/aspartoacylase family protein [Gammaproteobacteria bacterium]|nr:succinylglutamate desuccinylase/aspartoacylase family protein [Gammaproteobacteria bacterium]